MGRDFTLKNQKGADGIFQSTRPCGTRRYKVEHKTGLRIYFNPRAPVGRDRVIGVNEEIEEGISIHAPLWDATGYIHSGHETSNYFNPRAPVGRDIVEFIYLSIYSTISIHAPLWDATKC